MPAQEGMLCPVCREALVMSERQNIEIDYCPKCRGVWLDRGELDKIIERSAPESAPEAAPRGRPAQTPAGAQPGYYSHGQPHRKRKSWLSELFD